LCVVIDSYCCEITNSIGDSDLGIRMRRVEPKAYYPPEGGYYLSKSKDLVIVAK